MKRVESFTIGNVTYNAVRASAVDQDRLLGLISDPVTSRALNMAQLLGGGELSDRELVPMFMGMPHEFKTTVAAILMHKVVINGTETVVTVADFDGRMVEYNTLLSRLLQWNLADFFTYLSSVLNSDEAQDGKDAPTP